MIMLLPKGAVMGTLGYFQFLYNEKYFFIAFSIKSTWLRVGYFNWPLLSALGRFFQRLPASPKPPVDVAKKLEVHLPKAF